MGQRRERSIDGCPPAMEPLEPRLLLANHPLITEFLAINENLGQDADGDRSDWIEIHNPTTSAINLAGWCLRDSRDEWVFPSVTLGTGQYLLVFASGKDRREAGQELHTNFELAGEGEYLALADPSGEAVQEFAPTYPQQVADISYGLGTSSQVEDSLIGEGVSLRVLVPTDNDLGRTWTGGEPFDDSAWRAGYTSIGYERRSGYEGLIETDVQSEMYGRATSAYVRFHFDVGDPSRFTSLTLSLLYDDGFAAYLNGQPIAREHADDPLTYASRAADGHEADRFEEFDVTAYLGELEAGENILAVHALNTSTTSTDFLLLPELVGSATVLTSELYFADPTPWQANTEGALGVVADTRFSVDRGFYDEPFEVAITTATAGAEIRYTVDGTAPTATTGEVYAGPIPITGLTTLRAAAFKPGFIATNVDTQTYIFLDDVIRQTGAGFPSTWNGHTADYEMDRDVVDSPLYRDTIKDDLKAIPTLSLVTDPDALFASWGVGIYPSGEGSPRATSVELIHPDGSEGFQIDAAVQIQGGSSTGRWKVDKLSMRLKFKEPFGPTKLRFPLFGDDGTDRFDTLILDARLNQAWNYGGGVSPDYQRTHAQYTRDQFVADLQNATGGYGPHGLHVHLYLDGLYWGLYCLHERPDESFASAYLGGDREDYDVLKHNSGTVSNGTNSNYLAMFSLARSGLSSQTKYQQIQEYLDVPDFIDYMLVNFYVGNTDWAHQNWYATRSRVDPDGRWRYHSWDAEHVLKDLYENSTTRNNSGGPSELHQLLRANAEYRLLFADRIHRHLFDDGVLTPAGATAMYQVRLDEVDRAVVGESARWGDNYRSVPYTRNVEWVAERNRLLYQYFPARTGIVLGQLKAQGLYPDIAAPVFHVNGAYQHGGEIVPGDVLTVTAAAGTVYYTLDGSDPRLPGGALSPTAVEYTGGLALDRVHHVKARVRSGAQWSALSEASYYIDLPPTLRVTELMYNPAAPSPQEAAAGYRDRGLFEYLELRNIGDETIYLAGVYFDDGIQFTFPDIALEAGTYVLVVKDEAAFAFRYGAGVADVAGTYDGSLRDSGEQIVLRSPLGGTVHDFQYQDDWFPATDGEGFSLTVNSDYGQIDLWGLKEGWRASAVEGGTPGAGDDGIAPGSIVVNEVLAHSDLACGDWIELLNTTDQDIDIGGWFLSDDAGDLRKYEIPPGTTLATGDYLVLTEAAHFGLGPTGFALSELGEDVYLTSVDAEGRLGGYREHVDFGASPNGVTFGRYVKKSTGKTDFALLEAITPWLPNAEPFVGPLVVNEVMYHPLDPVPPTPFGDEDFEYVELYNRGAATLHLTEFIVAGGIGFTFGWYPTDTLNSAVRTLQAGATATWQASLPETGDYEVFAWWDPLDAAENRQNLDSHAFYEIAHLGGTDVVEIDQDDDALAGEWVSLGTYSFAAGTGSVTLSRGTDNPDKWTIADRVRFVKGATTIVADNSDATFGASTCDVTTLAPGEYVLIVRNLAAFDARYDISGAGLVVAGQYTGKLANSADKIKLLRADKPESTGHVPYVRIDHLNYDSTPPWPADADGGGSSLSRQQAEAYGNDVDNWAPSIPGGTPGRLNEHLDPSPPSMPEDVRATAASSSSIDLTWQPSVDPHSGVHHYNVYQNGYLVGTPVQPGYTSTGLIETATYTYRISAVNPSGYESMLSPSVSATPRPSVQSAKVVDFAHVSVTFGKPVKEGSAETLANYTITDPDGQEIPIATADLQPDGLCVTLALAGDLLKEVTYTLTVGGVEDLAGSAVEEVGLALFFRDVSEDVLAWWTFDEGGGAEAVDASGNGRNLEIHGAERAPEGRVGSALRFDGLDDFAVDEDGGAYINYLPAFTVAMWLKADEIHTDRSIFTTRDPGSSQCLCMRYDDQGWGGGGDDVFKAYLQTSVDRIELEGASGSQSLDWQHVVLTWASGDELRLYVDGAAQTLTQNQGTLGGSLRQADKFLLGDGESTLPWKGLIDEVRIYNRQLSDWEIAALVNVEPEAADDAYGADPDGELIVEVAEGVLANDVDADEGPGALTASLVTEPSDGELTFIEDGSFQYRPAEGFEGVDTFTYRAFDGLEYSRAATVTIRVQPAVPPTVTSFVRNDGAEHPGELTSVALTFSQDVSASLDAGDLTLRSNGTGSDLLPTGAAIEYDGETNTARWDLGDVTVLPGRYSVILSAAGVTGASGLALDGDGNGNGGDDYERSLMVATVGDADLDGTVGMLDYLAIKRHYGDAGAGWAEGDFDYDGDVDYDDYAAAREQFGQSMSAGAAEVLVDVLAAPPADPASSAPAPDAPAASGQAPPDRADALRLDPPAEAPAADAALRRDRVVVHEPAEAASPKFLRAAAAGPGKGDLSRYPRHNSGFRGFKESQDSGMIKEPLSEGPLQVLTVPDLEPGDLS